MAGSKRTSRKEPPTVDAKVEPAAVQVAEVQPPLVATESAKPEISWAAKVNQVLTWILEGNSDHLIRDAIAETWPGEDEAGLVLGAFEQVATSAGKTRAAIEDWCIEAMRFLYQKQVEIGDYGGAMRAVTDLHKLATRRADPEAEKPGRKQNLRIADVGDEKRARLAARIARLG